MSFSSNINISPKVINLSSQLFSNDEIAYISKGFKFCIPSSFDHVNYKLDLAEFTRILRFKAFFYGRPQKSMSPYIHHVKSIKDPPQCRNPLLEQLVRNLDTISPISNTNNEQVRTPTAIKSLQKKNRYVRYCKADKGGCIVILNHNDYEKLLYDHINDVDTYSTSTANENTLISTKIKQFCTFYIDFLSKDEMQFLSRTNDLGYNTIYILPKIHKNDILISITKEAQSEYISLLLPHNLTSRPIINNRYSPTKYLSFFLDKLLKPMYQFIPSFIKDTFDLLSKLPRSYNNNTVFISLDVKSLYTSIPHQLGYDSIQYFVSTHSYSGNQQFPIPFFLDAVKIVLENNIFKYKTRYFKQIRGTAMGTIMAPAYANIVMGYLEKTLYSRVKNDISDSAATYLKASYFRYLDDILIIWDESICPHRDIIDIILTLDHDIQFEYSVAKESINFLDVTIYKGYNNKIETDIFSKPTDTKQYLPFDSFHPSHTKRNIPYTLATRIKRLVSDPRRCQIRLDELYNTLVNLKYPSNLIIDAINKEPVLSQRTVCDTAFPFKTTYNPTQRILFHNFVTPNVQVFSRVLTGNDGRVSQCQRQPDNILQVINKNGFNKIKKCGKPRCKTCPLLICKKSIQINNILVQPNMYMDCNSKNLIYILFCDCGEYYVGETGNPLNIRVNLHRNQAKNPTELSLKVCNHLNSCGQQYKILPCYKLPNFTSKSVRINVESYFISILNPSLNAFL